jgi:hypothetical protein
MAVGAERLSFSISRVSASLPAVCAVSRDSKKPDERSIGSRLPAQ